MKALEKGFKISEKEREKELDKLLKVSLAAFDTLY
jgi:hypothetical protein